MVGKDQKIPAKIVCVENKKNKKDWIAFICTDPDLSEKEILQIFGKRWQIEVFFITCKTYLHLISECHSLSYDALTAHVAIDFARYMMIAMEQRRNEDDRSLGKIYGYKARTFEVVNFVATTHPQGSKEMLQRRRQPNVFVIRRAASNRRSFCISTISGSTAELTLANDKAKMFSNFATKRHVQSYIK